jgi:hypothetical protein
MSSDEEDTSLSDMAREFGFKIPTAASRSTVSTSGEFLGSGGERVNVSSPVRGREKTLTCFLTLFLFFIFKFISRINLELTIIFQLQRPILA